MTLALWLPEASNTPIIIYAVMYGFASGSTLSIVAAMVAKLGHISKLGARTGALYAFSSVGVLIGSPIGGAIQSRQHGGYSGLIIFAGVAWLIGTVLAVFSIVALVGYKVKVKAYMQHICVVQVLEKECPTLPGQGCHQHNRTPFEEIDTSLQTRSDFYQGACVCATVKCGQDPWGSR